MLTRIEYASFLNYSPRGKSDLSKFSREICGAIKAGRTQTIISAFPYLSEPSTFELLAPFIGPDCILIPIPRSSPLVPNALWPSKVIADLFVANGYGNRVLPCISRNINVRKSSGLSTANLRPSVQEHYNSLSIVPEFPTSGRITLIDDVLTLGRTSFACAMRVNEVYTDASISLFSMVRTQGLIPEINNHIEPTTGTISYNQQSGLTTRNP